MDEIDTGRLVLRPVRPFVARALLEERVPDGVVLAPGYPSEFSLEVMRMVLGGNGGYGPFFMVRKLDGAVVGEIGAHLDGTTAKVGYTVVEPSWGRGYATEALRALVAHLFESAGVQRVVGETLVGHAASRRVMEKAGLHRRGERVGEEGELVVYELLAPTGAGPPPAAP